MTERQKRVEKKRRNKNKHFRATLKRQVRKLIEFLRSRWAVIGGVERGQRLQRLISAGCSRRGLGRELGVSETSIRRHVGIADLPESDRMAIQSGASSKKILAMKAAAERRECTQRRVDEDKKTGTLSNKIADMILEFSRAGKELRKISTIRAAFPRLLDRVESNLRQFESDGHRAVKVSRKLDGRELFRKVRPRAVKDTPNLVHQSEWLAELLWLIAPERPIRSAGILKARKRASELLGMMPLESYVNAQVNRAARMIELTTYIPRPVYEGGARSHMQRQGSASTSADHESCGNEDPKP